MRRILLLMVLAATMAAMTLASALPAFADHQHFLVTPGTCVEDIASGQTSKGLGEPGYHKFHENVHLGTPGIAAFANEENRVSVDKGTCP
jgi:hypothetical protein